jgi:hypothetical protein
MPKPSVAAGQIRSKHLQVWHAFSNLAQACHDAGPLDEETQSSIRALS